MRLQVYTLGLVLDSWRVMQTRTYRHTVSWAAFPGNHRTHSLLVVFGTGPM